MGMKQILVMMAAVVLVHRSIQYALGQLNSARFAAIRHGRELDKEVAK